MKRLSLTLLWSCLATTLAAHPLCPADTIVKVVRPDSVVIAETDSTTQMTVFGSEGNDEYYFRYSKMYSSDALSKIDEHAKSWNFTLPLLNVEKRRVKWALLCTDPHFGWSIPLDKTGNTPLHYAFNLGCELLQVRATLPGRRDAFSIGLGIDDYILSQHTGQMWIKRDGQLSTTPYPEGSGCHRSHISYTTLSLPIRYHHRFGNIWINLAAMPTLNLSPRVSYSYKLDNKEYSYKSKGLAYNDFGISFRLGVRYKSYSGIYLQYTPTKLFSEPAPAHYQMLTIGVLL